MLGAHYYWVTLLSLLLMYLFEQFPCETSHLIAVTTTLYPAWVPTPHTESTPYMASSLLHLGFNILWHASVLPECFPYSYVAPILHTRLPLYRHPPYLNRSLMLGTLCWSIFLLINQYGCTHLFRCSLNFFSNVYSFKWINLTYLLSF